MAKPPAHIAGGFLQDRAVMMIELVYYNYSAYTSTFTTTSASKRKQEWRR